MGSAWDAVRLWPVRRWVAAVGGAVVTALLVAVPTAVIPTPLFGRAVAVTWWSYPVVGVTALLSGLLIATYVQAAPAGGAIQEDASVDRASRLGMAGAVVTFFAVGCPVCNKLVLLALGASGALTWFAPVQPLLAVASIALMVVALRVRLRGELSCPIDAERDQAPAQT